MAATRAMRSGMPRPMPTPAPMVSAWFFGGGIADGEGVSEAADVEDVEVVKDNEKAEDNVDELLASGVPTETELEDIVLVLLAAMVVTISPVPNSKIAASFSQQSPPLLQQQYFLGPLSVQAFRPWPLTLSCLLRQKFGHRSSCQVGSVQLPR